VGGAAGAIQNTTYRPSRGYRDPYDPDVEPVGIDGLFAVDVLPSYRLAIDLSELDEARIVQTTGQSGNPLDGHYGDLIELWRDGRSVTVPFSRSRVDAAAASTLVLTP
jgi:acyl-homoserine lactone acylase PvdQ